MGASSGYGGGQRALGRVSVRMLAVTGQHER